MKKVNLLVVCALLLIGCSKNEIGELPDTLRSNEFIETENIKFSYGLFDLITNDSELEEGEISVFANLDFGNKGNNSIEIGSKNFYMLTENGSVIYPVDNFSTTVKPGTGFHRGVRFFLNYKDLQGLSFKVHFYNEDLITSWHIN